MKTLISLLNNIINLKCNQKENLEDINNNKEIDKEIYKEIYKEIKEIDKEIYKNINKKIDEIIDEIIDKKCDENPNEKCDNEKCDNEICVLCISSLTENDIFVLKCNHIYHDECFIKYIKSKYLYFVSKMDFRVECPLCRCILDCDSIYNFLNVYINKLKKMVCGM